MIIIVITFHDDIILLMHSKNCSSKNATKSYEMNRMK